MKRSTNENSAAQKVSKMCRFVQLETIDDELGGCFPDPLENPPADEFGGQISHIKSVD